MAAGVQSYAAFYAGSGSFTQADEISIPSGFLEARPTVKSTLSRRWRASGLNFLFYLGLQFLEALTQRGNGFFHLGGSEARGDVLGAVPIVGNHVDEEDSFDDSRLTSGSANCFTSSGC